MMYARQESPSSSVVGASYRCTEGHGFDSRRGLKIFSLSHARDMLNIPPFLKTYFVAKTIQKQDRSDVFSKINFFYFKHGGNC